MWAFQETQRLNSTQHLIEALRPKCSVTHKTFFLKMAKTEIRLCVTDPSICVKTLVALGGQKILWCMKTVS